LRWADIDLASVRKNAATIVAHLPKGTKLFAVVKANGYGHGAMRVARAALHGGAWGLAVATLEEADELSGLVKPDRLLVMGALTPRQAPAAAASGCRASGKRIRAARLHRGLRTRRNAAGSTPDSSTPTCERSRLVT